MIEATNIKQRPVKHIRRENTPQEQYRRNVLAAVRSAVKMYPKEVVEIVREEILDKQK